MLVVMSQIQTSAIAPSATEWCARMQAKLMAALDAAWTAAEGSDDPAVIARAREKAKTCGQIAATVRKVAAMTPAPKGKVSKPEGPLELIENVVDRLGKASGPAAASEARPPAAQAQAMRAALRKLGRA